MTAATATAPAATIQGTPGRVVLIIDGRVVDQFASVRVAASYALDVHGVMPTDQTRFS